MRETKYKRISQGLNKPTLIPINSDYGSKLDSFVSKDVNEDYYETIYDYDESHKESFDVNKSVKGLRGLTTSKLVFDFDDKQDPANAKSDALELISRLVQKGVPEKNIQVYFSGNKGFHIQLETTATLVKSEVDNIIKNLTTDLKTADQKILDENRLFRLPLTKHKESQLFKIPLTVNELSTLSVDQIKKNASDAGLDNKFEDYCNLINTWDRVELPTTISSLKGLTKEQNKQLQENIVYQEAPNFMNKPKHLSAAKFALQEGFFEDGERNHACMILASSYRGLGYSKEIAYNMLKATLRMRQQRLGLKDYDKDALWYEVIETVYSPHWKGGTYSEKQDQLLQKVKDRFDLKETKGPEEKLFITSKEMVDQAFDFLKNLDHNRVFTGIKEIDEAVVITKGMLVGILGAPGSGKTSLANSLVEYTSMSNNNVFYHSFDMSQDLLSIKMIGKYCSYGFKKMQEIVKSGSPNAALKKATETFFENFKNVGFNFRAGFSVEQVRESIIQYKEESGQDLTLVVIDYLEKIHGPFSDATANSAYVASRLADMAKELNVCIVLLLQPNKQSGDVSESILSYIRIKGSSVIQQDVRVLLSLWRPGFDPETGNNENNLDKYTSIAILKQNMGGLGKFDFMWEPLSGTIRSMTFEEKNQYDEDIQTIKTRKAAREEKSKNDMF